MAAPSPSATRSGRRAPGTFSRWPPSCACARPATASSAYASDRARGSRSCSRTRRPDGFKSRARSGLPSGRDRRAQPGRPAPARVMSSLVGTVEWPIESFGALPDLVDISSMDLEQFRSVIPRERFGEIERTAEEGRELLDGAVAWNINSTARGGGVAELLRPLLAYARGAGVDARWIVIDGPPEFFEVTKRIHNRLHGAEGDGGPLDEGARQIYERVLAENMATLPGEVRPGDVVIVHDPQPAGLVEGLRERGAAVIWRCHVGVDQPNHLVREAWDFLRPYVEPADRYVFSRQAFVWDGLDRERVAVIRPSIDAFAPKNQDLDPDTVRAVLSASGIVEDDGELGPAIFHRQDETPGRIESRAHLVEDQP